MREISWSSIMRPQGSRTASKLSSTISLSRRGLAGYDRAAARRCADRAVQVQRFYRLAALVRGSHLFSNGFRNRAIVATNWTWNYITFQRGTRLITGMNVARMEAMPAPISKEPTNSGDVRHAA
jgi:hypothetical protein